MLDSKGFNLWADEYDKAVGLSDEENSYPFAGYKEVLGGIFRIIMEKEHAAVLDLGFGTGTLTAKLYEHGCEVYGQDFSERMVELVDGIPVISIPGLIAMKHTIGREKDKRDLKLIDEYLDRSAGTDLEK